MTRMEIGRTASAARRALSSVTSSTVPWISTRSTFWLRSSMTPSRIAWTSASLFLLPVIKFRCLGTGVAVILVAGYGILDGILKSLRLVASQMRLPDMAND